MQTSGSNPRKRGEDEFLYAALLEECVSANVGDLTFEEAYNRTKRTRNITVAMTGRGGSTQG